MAGLPAALHMPRVKVYLLNEDGFWDDRGTGHVTVEYVRVSSGGLWGLQQAVMECHAARRGGACSRWRREARGEGASRPVGATCSAASGGGQLARPTVQTLCSPGLSWRRPGARLLGPGRPGFQRPALLPAQGVGAAGAEGRRLAASVLPVGSAGDCSCGGARRAVRSFAATGEG